MAPPFSLSVVIVSKNAAKQLPRCLASVNGWADEAIVALTDESDDSARVASALGAKVCELTWKGYRDTKNEAVNHARNPWILSLDADEEVPPELRAEIVQFLRDAPRSGWVAARFPRKTWFLNRWITHGDWYPDHCLRLYHRDHARWGGGATHERLECDGAIATLKNDLLHYSFDSIRHAVVKLLRTADLAAEQHRAQGKPPPRWAIVARPCWGFFRCLVVRRGFLDGVPGLVVAGLAAFGKFAKYSRRYELMRSSNHPDRA